MRFAVSLGVSCSQARMTLQSQCKGRLDVANPVVVQVLSPIPLIRSWLVSVQRAAMPGAPVDEDGNLGATEERVRLTPKFLHGAFVEPVA